MRRIPMTTWRAAYWAVALKALIRQSGGWARLGGHGGVGAVEYGWGAEGKTIRFLTVPADEFVRACESQMIRNRMAHGLN